MTYRELLEEGVRVLTNAFRENASAETREGIEDDARELLRFAAGITYARYLAVRDHEASPEETALFREAVRRRAGFEPVQYITGEQVFMGVPFAVTPAVLIPRADTECLAETVLEWLRERTEKPSPAEKTQAPGAPAGSERPFLRGLDLCCGSGCLAISIALMAAEKVRMDASDLSEKALEVARKNASALLSDGCGVTFRQGDLFDALPQNREKYDFIVSNPPYIATETIRQLDPTVASFEPALALDGGEDGLVFYRRIAFEAPRVLRPGGRLFLEIGEDQGRAVSAILENAGFRGIACRRDYAGRDRVITAEYPETNGE